MFEDNERLISSSFQTEDIETDYSLRPRTLEEYRLLDFVAKHWIMCCSMVRRDSEKQRCPTSLRMR